MSDQPPGVPSEGTEPPRPPHDPGAFTQEIQHAQISARIPEKVGRGVFSSGIMVLQGPNEFVIDFVQRLAKPHQIVARVVLPIPLMPSLLRAVHDNLANYQTTFGPIPALRAGSPPATPPSIQEIYDNLKLPDDMLSGVYANAAMISHSQSEFCFDFITNFFPRSAVSCRVYMATPQVPALLNTLNRSFQQYQQKLQQPRPPEPPPLPG
ncbi:MAG: DUF3467 domain-containing protein [Gemmataceae bacterium]